MKTAARLSAVSPLASFLGLALLPALPLAASGAPEAFAGDEAAVVYEASAGEGSACLMVFATAGESFHYAIAAADSDEAAQCARGFDASGDRSRLPRGLRFDQRSQALEGVPAEPGFHEFVALVTEGGVTRERVILIDVAEPSARRSLDSFASYFLGGVR